VKIVLTVHHFFPKPPAGTELLTLETAKELQRRGHAVEIWTPRPTDSVTGAARSAEPYVYQDLRVVPFPDRARFRSSRGDRAESEHDSPVMAAHFQDRLRRSRPDVVHFVHFMGLSTAPVDVCVGMGVPTVFTPTDFWIICPTVQLRLPDGRPCLGPDAAGVNCVRHLAQKVSHPSVARLAGRLPDAVVAGLIRMATMLKRWERRYSPLVAAVAGRQAVLGARMNRIDRVLAPSRLMEAMLLRHGLDPGRVQFLPYGIDLRVFTGGPSKQPSDRLRVGFIGTLADYKGPHVLCRAIKLLAPSLPVDAMIYGDPVAFPDYAAGLARLAADEPRIHLCGTFPNSEIADVLSGLDVLVVPSLWPESTPLVIYAAQAARTPVIATALAGMTELVHHEHNGLLVEPGDAQGLAELIRRCVVDPSLLPRLAANAIPPRSLESYVSEIEDTYQMVRARACSGRRAPS
jgi:glycosyltransferase involved in cell wall biosynthesis